MKKTIIILLILVSFSPPSHSFQEDKVAHFSAGIIIYVVADYLNEDKPMRLVLISASAKELYDYFGDGKVGMRDIIATMGGGISAKIILFEYKY